MSESSAFPILQLNQHVTNLCEVCREFRFEHGGEAYRILTVRFFYPSTMLYGVEIAQQMDGVWEALMNGEVLKETEEEAMRLAVNWLDKHLQLGAFS